MWKKIPTPCYVVDEKKIIDNLTCLGKLEQETGCHVLLAQKAFSMYSLYPLIGSYISGTTASGLYEARLGKEEMGKENHVFAPAYKEKDMQELVKICDHIIFNSFSQYEKHRKTIEAYNMEAAQDVQWKINGLNAGNAEIVQDAAEPARRVEIGIRVNPEFSTQEGHAIYDPCAPGSRLGVTRDNFPGKLPEDISGLHFHTLCEQDSDDLEATFRAFEKKFAPYLNLEQISWINLGGGHHITRPGYDLERLVKVISYIKETYGLKVYLEPGEAIALNAGYLVTEVQDIVHNQMDILILDASAACHMPDVLEMPYRPPLQGGFPAGEKPYTYRLSSMTCLAGDVIGDYSFEQEIRVGNRLIFEDMAIYSMVKNNTFNGIGLPSIALLKQNGEIQMVKEFSYEDFKGRLS
ncbi:MAG: carboxynorspermidine decarboxylase [Lachnospiraceae bacterium]|nr:carboxynorspermidine decarboxylase [Lachnospiraceae bacterium]